MTTIPIPLPFGKGVGNPIPSHQYYDSSSPAGSSSSTPIQHNPVLLQSNLSHQSHNNQFLEEVDSHEEDPSAGPEDEENIFRDMSWEEILEDLNARFLINLPKEEMSLVRVYWQAEQAHWFYEDYLRPLNPLLPSLSQRNFTRIIIESSPLYASLMAQGGVNYDQVWEEYCSYKRMVPCCGGILINKIGDKCLMVRGYKSNAGWSFPRGKINLEESEEACAIREVEEETGFDLTGLINPVDKIKTHINAQEVTMFIIKGIDESTIFETQTRNEIGAIEWVKLADLPTWINKRGPKRTGGNGQKKFYNVTPFVTPLKLWLKDHGIDPYMKSKKKAQPAANYRDLQPYQFDSPSSSPQPASPALTRGSSTLDHLFARFIHKQEEELSAPVHQAVVGSDNKAGLERLFGNLNVLEEEEQSLTSKQPDGIISDQERQKKEDDALARLLGGIGIAQTPVPEPSKPTPTLATQKQNNLLAMLNARPAVPPIHPQQAQAHPTSPTKPHQAKLLSMFSSQSTTSANNQASSKPISLPTSPGPMSSTAEQESQRKAKARALLDMTLAGIGLDVPANASHQMSHPAFSPPMAQPGTSNGSGAINTVTRITPPGQKMPPTHQPPPSSYTHSQAYRHDNQPPNGTHPLPRPPVGPTHVPQGVYGGSPNRSSQPPRPYEATNHNYVRGDNPSQGHDHRAIPPPGMNLYSSSGQARPFVGPPGLPNLHNVQGFRPINNPLPGNYAGNFGNMSNGVPGNGPHPPLHHLPPSSLQGGFVPPPHPMATNQQHLQVRPVGMSINANQPNLGYQTFLPVNPLVQQSNSSQHQQYNSNLKNSPPKSQNINNNPNVHHPVPRPPQGQGAALLAMINGGNNQAR
ncbi:uncharacterized protein L201_000712 [Kwoniella dendrophila CBS 6074]|uniref:Nudix hydrolase domain-containing protein n=1 Tax=Kwoniella dendrophila CBS 6074 TaxID=1295534 RepID=A0AAX4JMU3_9TREE